MDDLVIAKLETPSRYIKQKRREKVALCLVDLIQVLRITRNLALPDAKVDMDEIGKELIKLRDDMKTHVSDATNDL